MGDSAALSTLALYKRYGARGRWVLEGIDLEVRAGAITALVGPNGSGKSTLIKCWIGFESPSRGRALVRGVDSWRMRGHSLAMIGYVPQGSVFYRALTVDEHIEYARSFRDHFDAFLVRRRLAILGIPLHERAVNLSGGQRAQVSLAIALGTRAPILILDEPLASLDPLARREFLQVLVDTVRTGDATALLSSHVVTDVDQACSRVILLSDGQIRLDLDVSEALSIHRLALPTDIPLRATVVASVPSLSKPEHVLVRGGPYERSQQASLEDIVIGYLAAGRPSPSADDLGKQPHA